MSNFFCNKNLWFTILWKLYKVVLPKCQSIAWSRLALRWKRQREKKNDRLGLGKLLNADECSLSICQGNVKVHLPNIGVSFSRNILGWLRSTHMMTPSFYFCPNWTSLGGGNGSCYFRSGASMPKDERKKTNPFRPWICPFVQDHDHHCSSWQMFLVFYFWKHK